MALVLDAHADVGEREVARQALADGYRLHGVALAGTHGVEGILQVHIGVEGVVLRPHLVLGHAVVEGHVHLGLVGEELAQLEICRHGVRLLVLVRALQHALLKSAEAVGHVAARQTDAAEVRQLNVEIARCCPAALVVILLQAQLVDPHLARLRRARQVAHADDHRLHLAQAGVTHDAHLVVGTVVVVLREQLVIAHATFAPELVACLLDAGEDADVDVEHVLVGPHLRAVVGRQPRIAALGGQLQRYLVLVVVVLVVAAQTDEDGQLVVLQVGGVGQQVVGMNEHLQALVLAQVVVQVLIDGLRLALTQVADGQTEGLLVVLDELRLVGVGGAADARRQGVGHGLAVGVLLNVDGAHLHRSRLGAGGRHQALLVLAPLAAHEVEASEAQHDRLFEAGEEHTHEAD